LGAAAAAAAQLLEPADDGDDWYRFFTIALLVASVGVFTQLVNNLIISKCGTIFKGIGIL